MADAARQTTADGLQGWEVLLSAPAARPIHSMVQGPDGRWCLSDELNHRLIIVHPDGTRHLVGGPGYGVGEFLHPRGLAVLTHPSSGATQLYVCDAGNHRIQILTPDGLPIGAFGGFGSGPGQFNAPSDITVALPIFGPEQDGETAPDPLLVVADQRNSRLQVFEPDGVFVRTIGAADAGSSRLLSRAGWPHFRTGADPYLPEPYRVVWQDEALEVTCGNGAVVEVDLAAALLPDFATWRRDADERPATSDHPVELQRPVFRVLEGGRRGTASSSGPDGRESSSVERHLCRI